MEKIRNYPAVIVRGLGEADSRKKPKAKSRGTVPLKVYKMFTNSGSAVEATPSSIPPALIPADSCSMFNDAISFFLLLRDIPLEVEKKSDTVCSNGNDVFCYL